MSERENTRESTQVDTEVQLQNMHKKYEQMAVDHEQAEEVQAQMERDMDEEAKSLPIPTKIIIVCLALFFGGAVLLMFGITDLLDDESKMGRDISLITLGTILLIPGIYYNYQLICACFASTRSERQQILNEFPLDYYD